MKRVLAGLPYQPTPGSLLRIAGWCGLFFYLSTLFLPRIDITRTQPSQSELNVAIPMMLESDPRWIRDDFGPFAEGANPSIAWVTGSSVYIKKPPRTYYLPELVSDELRQRHGLAVTSYMYTLTGRRPIDTYVMIKDAISRKPNYIVVIINPFWEFNDKALFFRTSVFNQASKQWWNGEDWLMQFTMTSPKNHLFALLGQHIPVIASSHDYFDQLGLRQLALDLDLKKNEITHENSKRQNMQPLHFWMRYDSDFSRPKKIHSREQLDVGNFQEGAISLANTAPTAWPNELIRKSLDALTKSGIPSLIYVAPVSATMSGVDAVAGHERVVLAISSLKSEYEGRRMRIVESIPREVVDTMKFRDYLHPEEAGSLPIFLSDLIYCLASNK